MTDDGEEAILETVELGTLERGRELPDDGGAQGDIPGGESGEAGNLRLDNERQQRQMERPVAGVKTRRWKVPAVETLGFLTETGAQFTPGDRIIFLRLKKQDVRLLNSHSRQMFRQGFENLRFIHGRQQSAG